MTAEHAAAAGGEVVDLAAELGEIKALDWEFFPEPGMAIDDVAAFVLRSDWLADHDATTRATAADTVIAAARRLCCGDNPAPEHAATDAHSQRMAFAEELARAVRGS